MLANDLSTYPSTVKSSLCELTYVTFYLWNAVPQSTNICTQHVLPPSTPGADRLLELLVLGQFVNNQCQSVI